MWHGVWSPFYCDLEITDCYVFPTMNGKMTSWSGKVIGQIIRRMSSAEGKMQAQRAPFSDPEHWSLGFIYNST